MNEKTQKKPASFSYKTIGILLLVCLIVGGIATINLLGSNSQNNANALQWLDNYSPAYTLGAGSNNFWITFPPTSPVAGQEVTHLPWIVEDLQEKPVVFVCHRTGCGPCTPQADRVKALRTTYGDAALFYDLDYPFEGYGTATADILDKFYNAFYYDPNGGDQIIAFTGVFTKINDNGVVKIGWHSWEGNVADMEMESWIKDSIYYYQLNSEQ
jgi:hypothetical protein